MKNEVLRAVPFMLLSDTRRRVLAEQLSQGIAQWLSAWLPGDSLPIHMEITDGRAQPTDIRTQDAACFRVRAGQEVPLALVIPTRSLPMLVGAQAARFEGTSRFSDEKSLAAALEREALRRLATAVLRSARPYASATVDLEQVTCTGGEMLREHDAARFVRAAVTLGENRCLLVALLAPAFVASLVPAGGAALDTERVGKRRGAAADESVAVEALLGEAEVSVSDLAALTVGDIIVLDRSLTDAGDLAMRGGGRIGGVTLGRVDGKRAIQMKGRTT